MLSHQKLPMHLSNHYYRIRDNFQQVGVAGVNFPHIHSACFSLIHSTTPRSQIQHWIIAIPLMVYSLSLTLFLVFAWPPKQQKQQQWKQSAFTTENKLCSLKWLHNPSSCCATKQTWMLLLLLDNDSQWIGPPHILLSTHIKCVTLFVSFINIRNWIGFDSVPYTHTRFNGIPFTSSVYTQLLAPFVDRL